MIKNIVVLIIAVVFCNHLLYSQSISPLKISTSDIDNFWKAYDRVQKSNDTTEQLNIVQSVYFDNATAGLKDFIAKSEINARSILRCMKKFPKFWTSVRPKTLAVKNQIPDITKLMLRYKKLYPQFKQPHICFAMGCLNMGGTTDSSEILIGTEITAADSTVDASELNTYEWKRTTMIEKVKTLKQLIEGGVDLEYLIRDYKKMYSDRKDILMVLDKAIGRILAYLLESTIKEAKDSRENGLPEDNVQENVISRVSSQLADITDNTNQNSEETALYCSDSQLTSLDIRKYPKLTNLDCNNNKLTSLDVSKNTKLTNLDCNNNKLTSLDVSKNTKLTYLACGHNQLTNLDVSKNTELETLDCNNNQLASLDVSKNTKLKYVPCYNNKLTNLDISKNIELKSVWCNGNQLTSLNVSKNPKVMGILATIIN